MSGEGQETSDIRILVAFEENYRVYREVIAAGLRILHPRYQVETSTLEAIKERVECFQPQVVISYGLQDAEEWDTFGWIELNIDPTDPTKIRLGERRWELTNPTLKELDEILEQV